MNDHRSARDTPDGSSAHEGIPEIAHVEDDKYADVLSASMLKNRYIPFLEQKNLRVPPTRKQ